QPPAPNPGPTPYTACPARRPLRPKEETAMAQTIAAQTVSREGLSERIAALPRVYLAHLPTALEEMLRLREALGPDAPRLFVERELDALVARLEAEGRRVYNVPRDRFSKVAGTCGYLLAALELLDQLAGAGARADHIFMAAGSSTAGLALAGKLLRAAYRVHP